MHRLAACLLLDALRGAHGGLTLQAVVSAEEESRRLDSCDPKNIPWDGTDFNAFFDDFRTDEEIRSFLSATHDAANAVSRLVGYGTSFEERPLELLEIGSDASALDKPLVFVQATQHAREWIAPMASSYLAYRLATLADGDGEVAQLLKKFSVTVAPLANPDGYKYSREENRMWRKNLGTGGDRLECSWDRSGVDLNRNWDWKWKQGDSASYISQLGRACHEVYAGPAPFSEPETRALADYVTAWAQNTPVVGFVDVHSYGAMLLPPWGWTPAPTADEPYQDAMSAAMMQGIQEATGRVYSAGAQLLGSDPGTAPDWSYGALGIKASLTIELPPTESSIGFCLPAEEIRGVGEELFAGVVALLKFLDAQGEGLPNEGEEQTNEGSGNPSNAAEGTDGSTSSTTKASSSSGSVTGWTRLDGVYCANWREEGVEFSSLESCQLDASFCMWNCAKDVFLGMDNCVSAESSTCGSFVDQAAGSKIQQGSTTVPEPQDASSGALRTSASTPLLTGLLVLLPLAQVMR